MTDVFVNVHGITHELHIDLWDHDDDGNAVWAVVADGESRYVEGLLTDEVWVIVDKAAKAYEEE